MLKQQRYWTYGGGYYAEVNRELVDIEKRYDLLRFKVGRWCVWPLLRFSVSSMLQGLEMPPSNAKYHFLDLAFVVMHDLYKILLVGENEVVVLVYDSNLSERRSNGYVDIFFDDLLIDIGNFLKIEHLSNPFFKKARKLASIRSSMTSTFIRVITKLLSNYPYSSEIFQVSQDLSSILQKKGLNKFTRNVIQSEINRFFRSLQLYRWLFRRIRPKRLLLVTAYCDHAPVAAAKSLGIEVIEFQHGYISPWHAGYSWSEYAKAYKKSMPIPDKIFLYGEYWREALLMGGFWEYSELPVVGSLRMDYHRRIAAVKPKDVNRLLLTTQPINVDETIAFMAQFLKEYNDRVSIELYIKLHPGETDKSKYEHAFRSFDNVKVLSSPEMPSTFDIIRSSHLHVSVASTCHYEALALGIPTAIIPGKGYELALPLTRFSECVFLVKEPSDMANLLHKLNEIVVSPEISSIFFANNALENMRTNL